MPGKGCNYTMNQCRVITCWMQDRRWCWKTSGHWSCKYTPLPAKFTPNVKTTRIDKPAGDKYLRKSCILASIQRKNYAEWAQAYLRHGERQYWGRVWGLFWTYEVWNLEIKCRNKGIVKNQNTRKGSFSNENGVQCHSEMEFWRVVVYGWDCRRKSLAVEVIEVE